MNVDKKPVVIFQILLLLSVCGNCANESFINDAKCVTCSDRFSKRDYKKKQFKPKPCDGCGQRQVIFQGDNTKQLFFKIAV